MKKQIGIFGVSGMARETRDIADELGFNAVLIARDQSELDSLENHNDVILEADLERYKDIPFVIGIGNGAIRRKIATRYAGKVNFMNLIHPDATFGARQRAQLTYRQGIIVSAGARFTCDISIGNFTIFNLNSTISHDAIIGDFVTISPQACILGNVEIESGAWIGAGAIINQGSNGSRRKIGSNTVIGSGAVILDDCASDSVYVGVPARKIK